MAILDDLFLGKSIICSLKFILRKNDLNDIIIQSIFLDIKFKSNQWDYF